MKDQRSSAKHNLNNAHKMNKDSIGQILPIQQGSSNLIHLSLICLLGELSTNLSQQTKHPKPKRWFEGLTFSNR